MRIGDFNLSLQKWYSTSYLFNYNIFKLYFDEYLQSFKLLYFFWIITVIGRLFLFSLSLFIYYPFKLLYIIIYLILYKTYPFNKPLFIFKWNDFIFKDYCWLLNNLLYGFSTFKDLLNFKNLTVAHFILCLICLYYGIIFLFIFIKVCIIVFYLILRQFQFLLIFLIKFLLNTKNYFLLGFQEYYVEKFLKWILIILEKEILILFDILNFFNKILNLLVLWLFNNYRIYTLRSYFLYYWYNYSFRKGPFLIKIKNFILINKNKLLMYYGPYYDADGNLIEKKSFITYREFILIIKLLVNLIFLMYWNPLFKLIYKYNIFRFLLYILSNNFYYIFYNISWFYNIYFSLESKLLNKIFYYLKLLKWSLFNYQGLIYIKYILKSCLTFFKSLIFSFSSIFFILKNFNITLIYYFVFKFYLYKYIYNLLLKFKYIDNYLLISVLLVENHITILLIKFLTLLIFYWNKIFNSLLLIYLRILCNELFKFMYELLNLYLVFNSFRFYLNFLNKISSKYYFKYFIYNKLYLNILYLNIFKSTFLDEFRLYYHCFFLIKYSFLWKFFFMKLNILRRSIYKNKFK